MNRKEAIHKKLNEASLEMLEFIRESENNFNNTDRWVPAAIIRRDLDLLFEATPKNGTQHGRVDWVFTTFARMLEDKLLIEYKKENSKSFYRSLKTNL